jgi:hypothetical protein
MRHNIVSGTVTNRRDHVPARKIVKRVLIIIALIFGAMLALGLTINGLNGDLEGGKREELPACKYEDDHECYWDAETQGNGVGHDVVNR